MKKFKVGDRVRVRPDLVAGERYRQDGEKEARCLATVTMAELAGKVVTIADSFYPDRYRVVGSPYSWTDDMFVSPANANKIVVTTDGKTTTARLFSGKELVKSAEAKCSPRDEFVFETGAALAMARLLDREKKAEPEAPKFNKDDLVTGRFGCMSGGKWFVVVGDRLIYESGGYDRVDIVDLEGRLTHYGIDCITEGLSYSHARDVVNKRTGTRHKVIWTRPGVKFE
jgi:hypothetical protein